jgi:hypothetical protein
MVSEHSGVNFQWCLLDRLYALTSDVVVLFFVFLDRVDLCLSVCFAAHVYAFSDYKYKYFKRSLSEFLIASVTRSG